MDKCLVKRERDGAQLLKLKRTERRARLEANKDSLKVPQQHDTLVKQHNNGVKWLKQSFRKKQNKEETEEEEPGGGENEDDQSRPRKDANRKGSKRSGKEK